MVDYIMLANKYYDSREPWKQVKEDIMAFNDTTYTCVYMMANMANIIAPILPKASAKIKTMLGLPKAEWKEANLSGDYQINNLRIIYDRLKEKKIEDEELEIKKR